MSSNLTVLSDEEKIVYEQEDGEKNIWRKILGDPHHKAANHQNKIINA